MTILLFLKVKLSIETFRSLAFSYVYFQVVLQCFYCLIWLIFLILFIGFHEGGRFREIKFLIFSIQDMKEELTFIV